MIDALYSRSLGSGSSQPGNGILFGIAQSTATSAVPPPTLTPSATPVAVVSLKDIQRIMPAEAKALVDSGSAVLYDVRSEAEYQAQHAAGALPFPGAAVVAPYSELPADKSLVFY